MFDFEPSDEKTHEAGPHKHWNESFYVNFFDPAGNWGGASLIGYSPNQGFADGFICLYFPNGATGFIRTWELKIRGSKAVLEPDYKKYCTECASCYTVCGYDAIEFTFPPAGYGIVYERG